MNVGPTFEDPTIAKGDDSIPPRLVTWISKNPHRLGHDDSPIEDYKKTLIWSVPPKAIVGQITVGTDGSVTFSGSFWTPRSPGGKDAKDLDDVEKDNLLALLHDEMNAVDAFAAEVASFSLKTLGTASVMSAALPTNVAIVAPKSVVVGKPALFTASAKRTWGAPVKTARYEWRFSNGARYTGARIRPVFREPGAYTLYLSVTDRFGARATSSSEVVVSGGK